ncbi:MAG TPA: hypothetical protein VFK13_11915 [Gemmatimonadaceae bacterium]|nr:hypothetical protein [Gemmatimonadaceae bacterium]
MVDTPQPHPARAPGTQVSAPRTLDRSALERVLARAAELQASTAEPDEPGLSEEQLVAIAREVGIAPEHVRQALAEERTRPSAIQTEGALSELVGATRVAARRVIRGTAESVLAALDQWMQREELLQVKRQFPDRILWERRPGLATEFRRVLNVGGRGYHLSRAAEVGATVVPVDAGRVMVSLEADLTPTRQAYLIGAGVSAGGGAAATAVLAALGFVAYLAAVPVAGGITLGYFIARRHLPVVSRMQLALEQVLDRIERGETPRPSLLAGYAAGRFLP